MDLQEKHLANAVVAFDASPQGTDIHIRDIYAAISSQFGSEARPVAVTRFRSDFIVQFATQREKETVGAAQILCGNGFNMLLVSWSSRYGSTTLKWETDVVVDITGVPAHAFHLHSLQQLLLGHCNIQTYRFNKRKDMCRVTAIAFSKASIPTVGNIAFQHVESYGIRNELFPVTINTYLPAEAPPFPDDDSPVGSPHSVASYDTGDQYFLRQNLLTKQTPTFPSCAFAN